MSRKHVFRLLLLFLPLMLLAYLTPNLLYRTLCPTVELFSPTAMTERERIPLTGSVAAKNTSALPCEIPYVISKALVLTGDKVTVGQPVALIDKEKSIDAILSFLSLAENYKQYQSLLGDVKNTDTDMLTEYLADTLYAPASGTVLSSSLIDGGMLTPGSDVLTVGDCDSLLAVLSVEEAYANRIFIGDTLYLRSVSTENKVYTAKVTAIAPAAAETLSGTTLSTTLDITASFDDAAALRPGYNLYGYYFASKEQAQLLIPLFTVAQEGENEYVWVWDHGRVYQKPIVTNGIRGGYAVVTSGLSPYDRVACSDKPLTENGRVRRKDGAA